jgi:hypothetical protein
MSWIARMGRHTAYLFTRTCPQCSHMMGRHQRRRDGSFQD